MLLTAGMLWPVVGGAEATKDGAAKDDGGGFLSLGKLGDSKEPITISSDMLEYDHKANVVVYRGNVQAAQGKSTLKTDRLEITLNDEAKAGRADGKPKSGQPARVSEVVAIGNVRIDQGTRWATGGHAVFDQRVRTVTLTQDPVLHDGPNEVAGDKVVVYLDQDRSVVEGGRRRVKAVLYPDKADTPGKAEAPATPAAQVATP